LNQSQSIIAAELVQRGRRLFDAPVTPTIFTKEPSADALLNDLVNHPHAFVLACVMDRQITAERAWAIPYRVAQSVGGFSIGRLLKVTPARLKRLFARLHLHRFPDTMSRNFAGAVRLIHTEYEGRADRIWQDRPPSAELVFRFLQFDGIGPKIATMAANILARNFKVPLADHFSIDVSADVQVRRVFWRLGLVGEGASTDAVIYRARALNPQFPGLMDFPAWEIGRAWCRPVDPQCSQCYMKTLCPTAKATVRVASQQSW
jgi:endonuclease-3